MSTKRTMVKLEIVPYLALFDLNKIWLEKKQERMVLIEQVRAIRTQGYNLTMEINEIEAKLSQAIKKLEKKQ